MFSIVITAYNQHDVTAVHVRECMNATVMPDEIIVVNDGGDDSLREKLLALDKKTKIVYVKINEDIPWNYTGARNLGVWLSRGDYLSMEDTDNIPSSLCYEKAFEYLKEHPDVYRVLYGRRPRITKEMALTQTVEEWMEHHRISGKSRPRHNDTYMMRREMYLKIKGFDERFATRYAWACSDFGRRLQRAGIIETIKRDGKEFPINHVVSNHFFAVVDANTVQCECEEKKFDGSKSWCLNCSKPIYRKSYKNYDMASERDSWGKKNKGHTQSPIGMLNFTYTFETL